jgi:diguanylate cyclase (GGDEF)-like protein/PAS domain S-box-containing protein
MRGDTRLGITDARTQGECMLTTHNADSLSRGVITFISWSLVAAGIGFALLFTLDGTIPASRIALNIVVALIGSSALLLYRAGYMRAATHLIVWGMFTIITLSLWRNGGLRAPNVHNYPVLIVVTAWLLGTRPTQWLCGLISATLIFFYFAGEHHWAPAPLPPNASSDVIYFLTVIVITTGLTLLSRRSYLQRIAEVEQGAQLLSAKDIELQKLSLAVEQSPDSIIITDLDANIEYVNEAFVNITGYSREEVIGKNPRILQSGKTPRAVYEDLWATLARGESWRGELLNLRKDGGEIIESAIIAPIRQANGIVTHYISVKQNITRIREAVDKIHYLTNFDHLTGLPNRTLLIDRLERSLAMTHRQPKLDAVIVINIDRFKNLNEARGLAFGDMLLVAFSQRIGELLRDEDTLARLSGDEFAILLHDLGSNREQASRRTMSVVSKIPETLRTPFKFSDVDEVSMSVSIGVTLSPEGQNDAVQNVLRRADTALHRAKEAGGARIEFFDSAMTENAEQRFRIERELRHAISHGELRLYLQPQVDAAGGWVSAEALVRWQHPERGLLPPGVFIPIAEESDLIIELDVWVMSATCQLIAREETRGIPLDISVNVSPRHFRQPNFVTWLKQLLEMTGADPTRLTLEVTEGVVINDINDVIAKMSELTEIGIHFSIDDFGTGYSSLAYLKRLPIHELKIDKTFIHDAPTDADDAALVETILSVARHMRLKVVAEGVETREQADFLNARGEVIHQGYLFGKPEPAQFWVDQLGEGKISRH